MKARSGEKIRLASVEELLGVPDEQRTTEIEISKIQPFKNHPFYVRDDEQMDDLVESIKANGVLTPVLVRETENGYEMVSGHRRMHASIRAGLSTIPAIVRNMSDDESIVYMVDANIQREELLPSEKSFAIRMKLEAMKRQAGRPEKEMSDNNVSQNGTHLRSDQELAIQIGSSRNQVQRYVRLTMLIPELLDLVDQKKLSFTLGVEISFLEAEVQRWIYEHISHGGAIKAAQVTVLRASSKTGSLDEEKVKEVLDSKPRQKSHWEKITMPASLLSKYFARDTPSEEVIKTILGLLEERRKKNAGQTGDG